MSEGGGRRTKVERVIDAYDLEEWGARLEAEWIGDGTDRTSLRDLAAEFNRAVLRAALEDADEPTVGFDVERTYRALSDDDVPGSDAVQVRRELERAGVDVEAVQRDFVTHQAVHTYLTNVREAELTRDDEDRLERKRETVQRLASRTQVVTDATLEELARADLLTGRNYEVIVDVQAVCEHCGRGYTVEELLSNGGCDCEGATAE